MPSFTRVAIAIAPLLLAARADLSDFEIDSDVPNQCRDVCRPVADLSSRCEVDLNDNDVGPGQSDDRWEDLLEAQCVCTNDSFDVGRISGLCASCIQQNMNNNDDDDDDDDMEDINSIMRICGFSSTSYASSDSTAASGITVEVTRPTATSELTTTITGGTRSDVSMTSTGSGPANTGNSNSNNDNNDNNNDGNDNSNNDDDSLAARNALPGMALGIAAAAVGASMLLL